MFFPIFRPAPLPPPNLPVGGGGHVEKVAMLQPIAMPADIQPIADVMVPVFVSKLSPAGTYANLYAAGNCTYGVASRESIPNNWGNANQWAYSASVAGFTVSGVPRAEAIAQTAGDSYLGHVAIVLSVNPDGSFVIWEENGMYGLGTTDERTTTTAEFPNFIYT